MIPQNTAFSLTLDALKAQLNHPAHRKLSAHLSDTSSFPFKVSKEYARKIDWSNPIDPLLQQILPSNLEHITAPHEQQDPLQESTLFHQDAGLIQKYRNRALLITTGHCTIHCRYCFRQNYPYAAKSLKSKDLERIKHRLETDDSIEEIILSGGDPLSLSNHQLQKITTMLATISHIKRLRIHTRTPVAHSARLDEGFMRWLNSLPWQICIVLHINHPNELDDTLSKALAPLSRMPIQLLNQSVLLKGVNDDIGTLETLSKSLFAAHILPYYLHQLDPVTGTAHFSVADDNARELHQLLQQRLPGYLVPRLVREIPHRAHKTLL